MMLKEENFKIFQKDNGFALKIIIPDNSGNYLHGSTYDDVNAAIFVRDLLMENTFYEQNISIISKDKYFRIRLELTVNDVDNYYFHSRKLNLNDLVFERMQLCMNDE